MQISPVSFHNSCSGNPPCNSQGKSEDRAFEASEGQSWRTPHPTGGSKSASPVSLPVLIVVLIVHIILMLNFPRSMR
eukprot:4631823-Amphidinium_carterae.1